MPDGNTANSTEAPGSRVYARAYQGIGDTTEHGLGDDARVLWRIARLAARNRVRLGFAIGAIVVAACFQLLIPHFLGQSVDHALGLLAGGAAEPEAARTALYRTAAFLLGASVLRGVFTLIHNYCGETVGHMTAYHLRLQFYRKLQQLSFSFHDRVHTGELITRGMLDLEGVRSFMNTGPLRVLLLAILIGVGAWWLLSADTVLGLLALSFVPFVAFVSGAARLRLRRLWFALQDRMAVLGRIMDENLTGIRVVRAFGAEPYELAKYNRSSDDAMTFATKRVRTRVQSTTLMNLFYFAAMGLVLWVGGLRVIDGAMTVGKLTEFLAFMTILQQPVRQLGMVINSFARAATCGSRLFVVLDLEPEVQDAADARPLEITDGTVRFENVSFAYHGEGGPPVLDGVSFEVRRGQTLAIVGPPGSGKSTVANLLPRYYDVTGGRIAIDGQDISRVTLQSLREAVKVVHQDPFLFTASLENNIAYGDPWAEDEAIRDAARTAQIDSFVDSLPDGFGTLVGERGVSLSGGQKQRVALARTVMLEPAVLVLDDSTAAIDAGTEQRIRRALKEQAENCATIVVSHRLGTLRHADEILFLEQGRVVERGTHEALLAAGGRYAALCALQSRESVDEAVADAAMPGAAE